MPKSPWKELKKEISFPKLNKDLEVDIAIVGGGLAGISTAYSLISSGKKIALIEKKEIGSGATEYTTAMVTQVIDTSLSDLTKMFGEEKTKLVWRAGCEAIDRLENIIATEKIDCDFMRCPGYCYAQKPDQLPGLRQDYETATKLDFKTDFSYDRSIGVKHHGVWIIPKQAKFHPLKFLYSLSAVVAKNGVEVYENTEAKDIEDLENGKILVKTNSGNITAKQIIMCTYQPFENPIQVLFKKGMYVSYELELRIPKGILEEALYWDMNNPYYYFRVDEDSNYDLMKIGGEDHRKELKIADEKMYASLERYVKEILPGINYEVIRKWDGPILEPTDGLALIGEYRPNHFVATAFSGTGMIYSMVSSKLLTDLIVSGASDYAEVFDPKRIPSIYQFFKKGKDYTEEFLGGALKNILKPAA